MSNKRLIWKVFGVMRGLNKPVRPRRKWLDDVQNWCNMDTYSTYAEHGKASATVGAAVDHNGLSEPET